MKRCIDVRKIETRLNRVEGQVRGVRKMLSNDIPCEDILIQIGAVKKAMHKIGQIILGGHMHHCIKDSIKNGNEEIAIKNLTKALEQFSRLE